MGGVFNTINLDAYQYAGQNPVKLLDPDGNAALPGAIFGLVSGVVTEVIIQATGNIIAGKSAFEDLDYSDIAISAGLGSAAGASGLGLIKQGKEAYGAYKKYKVANASLKARNKAIAAGKVRNAKQTAKVANRVSISKREMKEAIIKGAVPVAVKQVGKTTVDILQEQKKKDKKL